MSTSKEQKIRIGLFALVSGALLGLVLFVFAGVHLFHHSKTYAIVFEASVYGLQDGADITYNGVKVGSVQEVAIDKRDNRKVRVMIEVDRDTPITTDTKAYLQIAGITGLKTLDLRSDSARGPELAENSVIPVGLGTLDKLTKQAEDMADKAERVMEHVQHISERADQLVDQVATPLQQIMETAKGATDHLASASAKLDATIDENRVAIKSTLTEVQTAAKTTTALLQNQVGHLADNAGDVIGSLRDAIRDDNQQLRAAMVDIRQASRTFKELARDVKAKPSRLLFSDPAPDRKLP
ncbi:MAG: MCE family protein [Deltaproteobacteria bacterium]|nr:MCE family protein [Deltaproteobacteria bacterium]